MPRTLVVYYSRSGHAKRIAEALAARCGAELEAIQDVRSRCGMLGYLRSGREAHKKFPIEIRPVEKCPADYDLVIVGTPVWAGNISSPMRAYLIAHGTEFKHVAAFCTQGDSGAAKVLKDIAELCGRKSVPSLAIRDAEIDQGGYDGRLDAFLDAVLSAFSLASGAASSAEKPL